MKYLHYRLFSFTYTIKQWLFTRFTDGGRGIFACLIASAIVGIDTKQTMAYQIFTFLTSILLIAIIYSLRFPARFSASRLSPRLATVGVKLRYYVTIENKSNKIQKGLQIWDNFADFRPTWLEFKAIAGYVSYYRWLKLIAHKEKAKTKKVDLPTLLPNSTAKVTVEIEPSHRGFLRLTSITIARSDPFNLFNSCKTVALEQSLLILPKRYQLPPIQLPGSRRYQSGTVALASSVGDTEEFISLRDYRPGDPLRKIHWKSWAKTDKPIVKEEQDRFFVRHALILDTFQAAKESEKLEEAIAIAASFTCDLQTQESLLDLMFVGWQSYCFTSGRGLGTTEKMLEILAGVNACQDKSFDYLTSLVISRASMLGGCICILIAWDEARKKLVDYLQALGIFSLVLLVTDQKIHNYKGENFCQLQLGKIQEGLLGMRSEV